MVEGEPQPGADHEKVLSMKEQIASRGPPKSDWVTQSDQ